MMCCLCSKRSTSRRPSPTSRWCRSTRAPTTMTTTPTVPTRSWSFWRRCRRRTDWSRWWVTKLEYHDIVFDVDVQIYPICLVWHILWCRCIYVMSKSTQYIWCRCPNLTNIFGRVDSLMSISKSTQYIDVDVQIYLVSMSKSAQYMKLSRST